MTTLTNRDITARTRMALAQDTFTRADQSAFGTASDGETYSVTTNTHAVAGIVSNQGNVYYDNVSGGFGRYDTTFGSTTYADVAVQVRVSVGATTSNNNVGVYLRWQDANNYYRFRLNTSGTALEFLKDVSSSQTLLHSFSTGALSSGTTYWIKVALIGSTLLSKFWAASGSEPSTWNTWSDSAISSAGKVGLYMISTGTTSGAATTVDSLSVTNIAGTVSPRDISSRFNLQPPVTTNRDILSRTMVLPPGAVITRRDTSARVNMAVSQDTFTRVNQSGFGTATNPDGTSEGETWTNQVGSATASITDNEGHLTGASGVSIYTLGSQSTKDAEALARFSLSTASTAQFGLVLRQNTGTRNYHAFKAQSNTLVLTRQVNFVGTNLSSIGGSGTITLTNNSFYWLRARVIGSMFFLRVWADGGSEPTSWNKIYNDTGLTTTGGWGLYASNSGSSDVIEFDHFTVISLPAIQSLDISSRLLLQYPTATHDLASRMLLQAPDTFSQDSFFRADQSGFGTATYADGGLEGETWTNQVGSATASIVGNEGQLTGATGTNIYTLGSQTTANVNMLVRFALSATAGDQIGMVFRFNTTANYYRIFVQNNVITCLKAVSGVTSTVTPSGGSGATALTNNTFYWLRVYVLGSSLFVRVWADGTNEPHSWNETYHDTSLTAAGHFGILGVCASSGDTVSFDSFSVLSLPPVWNLDIASRLKLFLPPPPGVGRDFATRLPLAISQDTFVRANQSGWGTATNPGGSSGSESWVRAAGSATASIASHEGQLTGATGTNIYTLGTQKVTNVELLVRFALSATAGGQAGVVFRFNTTAHYYRVFVQNRVLTCISSATGALTPIGGTGVLTLTNNAYGWLRVQVQETAISVRVWADGLGEPTTWNAIYTDSSVTVAGQFGLLGVCASSGDTVSFDSFRAVEMPVTPHVDIATRLVLVSSTTGKTPPYLPALPGQTFYPNGTSSYAFGTNNTLNFVSNTIESDSTIQGLVRRGGFTLLRSFIPNGCSDAELDLRAQTAANCGCVMLAVLQDITTSTFNQHVIAYLGMRCLLYEFGNEPDLNGISISAYITAWNTEIPRYKAINPSASFLGPVSGDSGSPGGYIQQFIVGLMGTGGSRLLPDGITFHTYPHASYSNLGVGITNIRSFLLRTLGYELPVGCTEWNYEPGNPVSDTLYDGAFMFTWTTNALNSLIGAGAAIACQFDAASGAGTDTHGVKGALDMIDTTTDLPRAQYQAIIQIIAGEQPTVRQILLPYVPSPFMGGSGSILPVPLFQVLFQSPISSYAVNGASLLTQPHIANSPGSSLASIPAGTVFTLMFATPDGGTQSHLTNGSTVVLRFLLANGLVVHGPVRVTSTLSSDAMFQVELTTLTPISLV